jgi:hypothetical protein
MKPSKAIDGLKNLRLFMELEDKQNEIKFAEDNYEAIALAEKALEKQIPKKPDFTEDKEFTLCPCCNGNGLADKQKYCDNCGQKLDWSEESEE